MSRFLIYLLCVTEGALIITIELLTGQMVAPLYGATLFSWAAVIGVVVSSMALGYYASSRFKPHATNFKSIIVKLLFISGTYILLISFSAKKIETLLFVQSAIFLSLFGTVILFSVIPTFLLAMLPSMLVQQLGAHVKHSGKAAASVFFISTLGAVLSCFVTGFYLLPAVGIIVSLKIAGLVLLWVAILVLSRRKLAGWIFVVLITVMTFIFPRKDDKSGWVKILTKSEGISGQLLVVDAPRGLGYNPNYSRILFVNRMGQAFIDRNTGDPMWSYTDYMVYLCGSKGPSPRILLLGLGGGTLAGRLQRNLGAEVDAVEFDPRVSEAARKYFALSKKVNIILDDARHYLNTCKKKYDFILFDLFKGEVPASHVMTTEALTRAHGLLEENGMALINYSGFLDGKIGMDTRSVIKTVSAVFGKNSCKVMFTPEEESTRNSLIIGLKGNADPAKSYVNLNAYGKAIQYQLNHINAESIDLSSDLVLTDNKPVLEYLHLQAGLMWRKDFYINFTKKYLKEGVTLFD